MKSAFWNIIFGLFFVGLVLKGTYWLLINGLISFSIPPIHFALMALAIFRLTRLTSYDVITKFLRDAVAGAPRDSFLGTFSQLINCPWCTGLWFSFFVVFSYFALPVFALPIILMLALAAVGSLFQVFSNLLGWYAEAKKRMVLGNPAGDNGSTCG